MASVVFGAEYILPIVAAFQSHGAVIPDDTPATLEAVVVGCPVCCARHGGGNIVMANASAVRDRVLARASGATFELRDLVDQALVVEQGDRLRIQ